MIKILLSGCNGMMGQTITNSLENSEQFKIVCGISQSGIKKNDYPVYSEYDMCTERFDVIIDFSNPDNLFKLLTFSRKAEKPVVICTTGLNDEQVNQINEVSKYIPIFYSANTSIGVSLLIELVKKSVEILQNNFDIEIVEKHHNKKIDAPSGTALKIADAINSVSKINRDYTYDRYLRKERRSPNEIGIHSIRGGTLVGEHAVIFAGDDEIIEITHTALSKKIFAKGALRAAEFIVNRSNGLYTMENLLK